MNAYECPWHVVAIQKRGKATAMDFGPGNSHGKGRGTVQDWNMKSSCASILSLRKADIQNDDTMWHPFWVVQICQTGLWSLLWCLAGDSTVCSAVKKTCMAWWKSDKGLVRSVPTCRVLLISSSAETASPQWRVWWHLMTQWWQIHLWFCEKRR